MSKREFIEHLVISFFVVVTCVNLVMAFLGMRYEPEIRFGYQAFLLPVIYGGLGILPSAVTYSRKELSVRQMLVRKLLQLLLLEGIMVSIVFFIGKTDWEVLLPFMFLIVIISLAAEGVLWFVADKKGEGHERGVKAISKQKDGKLRGGPLLSVFLIPEP